jgi:hypothetical protein
MLKILEGKSNFCNKIMLNQASNFNYSTSTVLHEMQLSQETLLFLSPTYCFQLLRANWQLGEKCNWFSFEVGFFLYFATSFIVYFVGMHEWIV